MKSFSENKVNGKVLRNLDLIDLSKIDINDANCHNIYIYLG